MADKEALKQFATVVCLGTLSGLLWNYLYREEKHDPNFGCAFAARPNAGSVKLGDFQGPIKSIGIGGYLGDPFEKNLYDFAGRATLTVDGQSHSYLARGSIFIWQPGKVGDLAITISADEYSRSDFTLITFDKNGSLSKNPDEAFAFDNPDLKLVHPMQFRCSFIGPFPKPTDASE